MLSKLTRLFGNKSDTDTPSDIMALTDTSILAALNALTDPHTGKSYVAAKNVKNIQISEHTRRWTWYWPTRPKASSPRYGRPLKPP
ncbi:iron-sulfur cluster assembly protein [Paludibacterium denitrificans]|uniref:iron-sulfur cluster assembly protein n=1 Tax=Paludibacterium denitrificans TaxID=2675226 RepID=UPI0028AF9179|nr:iron-sulfur cluster assembly protein [Paludibacterium denitrificans]